MKILLDTCVLAELRRPKSHAAVRRAVDEFRNEDLFLSVLTVGEIAKGIALLANGRKKQELGQWLGGLERQFEDHILPVDTDIAQLWGEITARGQANGVRIPATDGLIAATALRHGLHIMTRNVRDFAPTGALLVNPWPEE